MKVPPTKEDETEMPAKLSTIVSKIQSVPSSANAETIMEFLRFMKSTGASETHQKNNLRAILAFARHLGPKVSFFDLKKKDQVLAFLDTRIRSPEDDPERKWITTWNDYLGRIKQFYRWLYNVKLKEEAEPKPFSEWKTPDFVQIKQRRTKRLSPYSENEIWERDELLLITKYEPHKRNKAALTLFWDLDARNHEVTLLRIKNIRLRERYGEGEVPPEAKTGSGPILLTCSFPYVRDWLNEHPAKDDPEAPIICSLRNGSKVGPEAMWTMMKQLRKRISRLLKQNAITDPHEREKLEFLLKAKKWNPYCLRHSAITADSDFLPEYALKKKVRWSMNSKQASRYIKNKMGNDLKRQILARNGIATDDEVLQQKPAVLTCPRCDLVNSAETKFCSRCSNALSQAALEEIKLQENRQLEILEQKHKAEFDAFKQETLQKLDAIMKNVDLKKLVPLTS